MRGGRTPRSPCTELPTRRSRPSRNQRTGEAALTLGSDSVPHVPEVQVPDIVDDTRGELQVPIYLIQAQQPFRTLQRLQCTGV